MFHKVVRRVARCFSWIQSSGRTVIFEKIYHTRRRDDFRAARRTGTAKKVCTTAVASNRPKTDTGVRVFSGKFSLDEYRLDGDGEFFQGVAKNKTHVSTVMTCAGQ